MERWGDKTHGIHLHAQNDQPVLAAKNLNRDHHLLIYINVILNLNQLFPLNESNTLTTEISRLFCITNKEPPHWWKYYFLSNTHQLSVVFCKEGLMQLLNSATQFGHLWMLPSLLHHAHPHFIVEFYWMFLYCLIYHSIPRLLLNFLLMYYHYSLLVILGPHLSPNLTSIFTGISWWSACFLL